MSTLTACSHRHFPRGVSLAPYYVIHTNPNVDYCVYKMQQNRHLTSVAVL